MSSYSPIIVQAYWLRDVVRLLYVMANEGTTMPDCVDPAELICDIVEDLGHGEATDPWQSLLDKLAKTTATDCCHRTKPIGAPCPAGYDCPND